MKLFLVLLFVCLNATYAQENTIPSDQMNSIKYEYNWKEEEFLIVNFRYPQDYCPRENYSNLDKTYKWLTTNVYANLDSEIYRNIYVYEDKLAAKPILDNVTHFDDIGHYFLKNFFDKKGNCIGLLIINRKGECQYIIGEYSSKDIQKITEALK